MISWDEKLRSCLLWFSTLGFLSSILHGEIYFMLPQSPSKNAHHFSLKKIFAWMIHSNLVLLTRWCSRIGINNLGGLLNFNDSINKINKY